MAGDIPPNAIYNDVTGRHAPTPYWASWPHDETYTAAVNYCLLHGVWYGAFQRCESCRAENEQRKAAATRAPWVCPRCGAGKAPHVDTCECGT